MILMQSADRHESYQRAGVTGKVFGLETDARGAAIETTGIAILDGVKPSG
jgi:hypothetical protein